MHGGDRGAGTATDGREPCRVEMSWTRWTSSTSSEMSLDGGLRLLVGAVVGIMMRDAGEAEEMSLVFGKLVAERQVCRQTFKQPRHATSYLLDNVATAFLYKDTLVRRCCRSKFESRVPPSSKAH